MKSLADWIKQPTTVAGIAASFSTFSALLLGQLTWGQAVSILIGAAASMVLPDNSAGKAPAPGSLLKTP